MRSTTADHRDAREGAQAGRPNGFSLAPKILNSYVREQRDCIAYLGSSQGWISQHRGSGDQSSRSPDVWLSDASRVCPALDHVQTTTGTGLLSRSPTTVRVTVRLRTCRKSLRRV